MNPEEKEDKMGKMEEEEGRKKSSHRKRVIMYHFFFKVCDLPLFLLVRQCMRKKYKRTLVKDFFFFFFSASGMLPKGTFSCLLFFFSMLHVFFSYSYLTSESHSHMDGVNLTWKIQSSFVSLIYMDFCFESNGQKSVSEVALSIRSPCKLNILKPGEHVVCPSSSPAKKE